MDELTPEQEEAVAVAEDESEACPGQWQFRRAYVDCRNIRWIRL